MKTCISKLQVRKGNLKGKSQNKDVNRGWSFKTHSGLRLCDLVFGISIKLWASHAAGNHKARRQDHVAFPWEDQSKAVAEHKPSAQLQVEIKSTVLVH